MKVAIVHYWLVDRRGGERVVEAICQIYPQADIYTHVLNPAPFTHILSHHTIYTTFINRLPFAQRLLEPYLCLMPLALEQIDLRGYDLVISSESGPAKGVVVAPDGLHICYCHSPMRYVWDLYPEYLARAGFSKRLIMRATMHYLRIWDQISAQRPDFIVANSEHTRRRISKYWRRDAELIPPPVDTDRFNGASKLEHPGDYYLCAGQLMAYKRIDLAVAAFSGTSFRLIVAGSGPELTRLKRDAGPNITFVQGTSDEEFARLVAGCRALIFPGEEDFGIVPVEAMAAGRPVIAYRRGGVIDSVVEGKTGIFFDEQSPEALLRAVERFERERLMFDGVEIALHANHFAKERFQSRFREFVEGHLERRRPGKPRQNTTVAIQQWTDAEGEKIRLEENSPE